MYYRLKTISLSGEEHYSHVLTIRPTNCGEEVGDFLNVYPNPIKEGWEVNVVYENKTYSSKVNLKIISMIGVTVLSYDLRDLDQGINNFQVDLSKVPAGNYFLQVENSEGRFSRVRLAVAKQ